MHRYFNGRFVFLVIGAFMALVLLSLIINRLRGPAPVLLTDPFLQYPTADAVRVVWFTEFKGDRHSVEYGPHLTQSITANTIQLTRMWEDSKSRVGDQKQDAQIYSQPVKRDIWRHEAEVNGLVAGQRIPYRVVSQVANGKVAYSDSFTLAPLPSAGTPLKILLTSDHQLMPMTPANLQKVEETVGQVDAIFLAGDLVNIPDRASEWFDDNRGRAFFAALQGRASAALETETGETVIYRGGRLIQSAPLFSAIGNHEVMGRFSVEQDLNTQFNDPIPRSVAEAQYAERAAEVNPLNDPAIAATWIKNQSFNTDTYHELFTLPQNAAGHSNYYAVTVGDVRLVVLYVTNIWRTPSLKADARGRYRERDQDLSHPEQWGYGQHIFEAIAPGSAQYTWLQAELASPEFTQAPYKIVMFHHPPHSLGDNIVPAYTDPVPLIDSAPDGSIKAVRYEYPQEKDYLLHQVIPLLEAAGTHLVFYGHSHLWNRFTSPQGTHYLETSNVGNTYGAFLGNQRRSIPLGFKENYAAVGDPNGLAPVMPTIAPLMDDSGKPQPFIASNDITVFTILDTGTGLISSYCFHTRQPHSPVVKFDEFSLLPAFG